MLYVRHRDLMKSTGINQKESINQLSIDEATKIISRNDFFRWPIFDWLPEIFV